MSGRNDASGHGWRAAVRAAMALAILVLWGGGASSPVAQQAVSGVQVPRCAVRGTVAAGTARLPGVAITITPAEGGAVLATSSLLDGSFAQEIPGPGRYQLKAELAAFAPLTQEVTVGADCQARLQIAMTLASRTAGAAAVETRPIPAERLPAGAQFQRLSPVADATGLPRQQAEATAPTAEETQTIISHLSLPPGFSPDSLADSIAAVGSTGQTNTAYLFGGFREGMGLGMMGTADLFGGGPEGQPGMMPGIGMPGAPGEGRGGRGDMAGLGPGGAGGGAAGGRGGGAGGGPGGGMGGPPGGGRGGPGMLAGRLGMAAQAMNNRPRGQLSYTFGGSPLDAAPYSLTGQPTEKPQYLQQRVSGSVGGQVKIPGLFDLGTRSSFFLNYSGNRSTNLNNQYSTVPTLAAREGDFSSLSTTVTDPLTGAPFPGNQIPEDRISPAAQALLRYYPEPNQEGSAQNYYYATTTRTTSDDVNFRFTRSFGTTSGRGGPPGGGPMGGGGRGGGRGGMMGGMNLNVGVHYQRSESAQNNRFPTITGQNHRTGWDVPVSFSFSRWGIQQTINFQFNRGASRTTNASTDLEDVAGTAGITGVSTDPFDWGVPSLSLSTVSGLSDISPSQSHDRTITISDSMTKMRGRHAIRFGGDFRDQRLESWSSSNARGSFVFTGLYSGGDSAGKTGLDFADFLLGLAQQASVQYGPGLVQYRTRAFNLYIQDDWRVRTSFTVNAGLRYEYQAPYWEVNNHLVNLDVAPDFTAAVPVIAGEAGPFTGLYPATIVEPDRNNLSPRIGVAWRAQAKTIIRGGYGINYASVPYLSFAQRMASQPPFAVTDTRIGTSGSPLPITAAFNAPSTDTTTNNFGVDRNYRLGYVHVWNVDVQRELTRTLSTGATYTGTKGSQLDLQRAPNRGPSGLLIEGVQPFIWESSGGRSIMHALSVRVSRRQAQGIAGSATYTLSTARDNASSTGGGATVVAQNDQDLEAEWGRSSFAQRHRFSANFSWELPLGPNRRWLNGESWAAQLFGGWMLNGTLSIASGSPYTARVTGSTTDVARGTNGTLRADYTGAEIQLENPTIAQFFNTAAFTVPATGTFGNAARNTITGPGSHALNMGLMKNFTLPGSRSLSLRFQATNVLNTPQWGGIDTVVNSPTFGRVTSARAMRSVQAVVRVSY